MRPLLSLLLRAAIVALSAGCAGGAGEPFWRAKGQGDRAYSSGRYLEAAGAYDEASTLATRPRDRAEALYLEASAFARARSWDRAREVFARLVAELPATERATRARFDLAILEIDTGNVDRGYELLIGAVLKHPNDGLAPRALERWADWYENRGGNVLKWLRDAEARLGATELDETVRYLVAGRLEAAGDLPAARDAYVACAERHPYPEGALFDDALWHASLLEEKMGRTEPAILHLRRMLAVREESTMVGSYERPRFSAAQFRIAVLFRDKLNDSASARREFHKVYASHTTSILRDDALWEEAKLAQAEGDRAAACSLLATLAKDFRASRYIACAPSLCPTIESAAGPLRAGRPTAAPSRGECHAYLLRVGPKAETENQ